MNESFIIANSLLIGVLNVDGKFILPDMRLVEDLGVTPIQMTEIIRAIKNQFDIVIPLHQASNLVTVADLYNVLYNRDDSIAA